MTILQSIALALGIIGMMWLFTVIGRVVRWLGRKRRAKKAAVIDRRVELELTPDEELWWVDSWRAQPVGGAFIILLGFLFFSFWAAIAVCQCVWPKPGSQTGAALALCAPFACFGLFIFYFGIYTLLLRGKNYFFVTSKRMAFRGVSFTGRRILRDVPPGQIQGVELVDLRMNGIHFHYRVRVVFDDEEGNTRKEEILPDRDPERFANAILTLRC